MTRLTSIAQRFAHLIASLPSALSCSVCSLVVLYANSLEGGWSAYSIEVGAYDPVQVRLKVIVDNGQSLADKVVLAEVTIVQ